MTTPGVRQVIPKLNYNQLVMADIIPFGVFDSIPVPKKKFPTIVYQTHEGCPKFGHFVEAFMRACIENPHTENLDELRGFGDERLQYYPGLICEDKYASIWKKIREYAVSGFAGDAGGTCVFEGEICGKFVAGHPDIIKRTPDGIVVVDVKTTSNFEGMREETVLQLLSYAAICRYRGARVDTIAVALPWQHMTIEHDITDWSHENFLFMLESTAQEMTEHHQDLREQLYAARNFRIEDMTVTAVPTIPTIPTMPTVGTHVNRGNTLYETFHEFYKGANAWPKTAACQIFLAGNQRATKKKFSDEDVAKTASLIQQHDLRTFIHAPYNINLSRPFNKRSEEEGETFSWAVDLLRYQIETGTSYGARGVVVHVGKPGTSDPKKNPPLTVSEAKTNMSDSIRKCLDICTPQCQLLIETPAGQGTELYTDKQELWEFWNEFTIPERSRMGICIDTCHVFAAGHDPVEYLQFWLEHDSTAICLIHLNDSKHERGSRKDRHAAPGYGHIGLQTLNTVVGMANQYGIPMVME